MTSPRHDPDKSARNAGIAVFAMAVTVLFTVFNLAILISILLLGG